MTDSKWLALFLDHLRIDKGSSPHTLVAYERDLKQVLSVTKLSPEKIEETHLQQFLSELKSRDQKATSIARKISAIRQFFQFLMKEELIENDPSLFLESPIQHKRLPKALDEGAIVALLKAADEGLPYEGRHASALKIRDQAMIYLLYATGVRVSELLSLQVSKTDIEAGLIRVMGKRSKERIIPFARIAGEHLYQYLHTARPTLVPKTETLFVGQNGSELTRQAFWKTLKKLAVQAGLKSSLHPHLLRHTFATDLLKAGMNLRSLQMLLGHSDLQTTEIYTHVAPDSLKQVIDHFHPRGRGKNPQK